MTAHYKNYDSIKTMDDLRSIFPSAAADEHNWCLLSTSGVHGTYTTLDNVEKYFSDPEKFIREENGGEEYEPKITVLVIRPRLVSMLYGHIEIAQDDIPFLRNLVNSSVESMRASQLENIKGE